MICANGECQFKLACNYCSTCLTKVVKDRMPKSRWSRVLNRLFRYESQQYCDFSEVCPSCQNKKCSQKNFIFSILNYVPKQSIFEYQHPRFGVISSYVNPNGHGKEWKRKYNTLMKYGCCQTCGTKHNLTIDHIKELSKGGSQRGYHNLTVLCYDCNQRKSNPRYNRYKIK